MTKLTVWRGLTFTSGGLISRTIPPRFSQPPVSRLLPALSPKTEHIGHVTINRGRNHLSFTNPDMRYRNRKGSRFNTERSTQQTTPVMNKRLPVPGLWGESSSVKWEKWYQFQAFWWLNGGMYLQHLAWHCLTQRRAGRRRSQRMGLIHAQTGPVG